VICAETFAGNHSDAGGARKTTLEAVSGSRATLAQSRSRDADIKVTPWMIEAGSPNVLLRRGVTKATVTPGTQVVVDGYQAKDGSTRANGRDITLPDGRKLFLGTSGTGAPYDEKK
jgi:hypothetical protein